MQFLPANTDRKAEAVNPIQLSLNSLLIESDGTFQLVHLNYSFIIKKHHFFEDYHYDY
jgi:hypothetical protein